MAEVVMKARHIVRPSEKTWTGTMKLSEFDMALGRGFLPDLFVYRAHKEWDSGSMTRTIKESLGKALVHFYPFAGKLRVMEGGRLELVVDEAVWGVPVLEAETALEVAELGDLVEAEEKGRLRHLIPMPDYSKPIDHPALLTVQITQFRCGGVAVGVLLSHAVIDGFGAGHFFSEWTRFARGEELELEPINDRSILRAGEAARAPPVFNIRADAAPPLPAMFSSPFSKTTTVTVKLPVSKSQINTLKQFATTASSTNARPFTRYEVLTAHAWRSAAKARGQQEDQKKLNALGIAVDFRRRLNPPIPRAFAGNSVVMMTATSETGDLVSNLIGYACTRIRETIDKVTDEFVWKYVDYLKSLEDLGAWRGMMTPEGQFLNPDITVVSWMNLSIYGLDFGWGKEAHKACAPNAFEGTACLLPGKEEGSVVLVMCLQAAHADKFKDFFFSELN